jgi:hypothetical protein
MIGNNKNNYRKNDFLRKQLYYKDLQLKQEYDYKKLNEKKTN